MRKLLALLTVALVGCSNYELEQIKSYDEFYILIPEVIESIVYLKVCETQSNSCHTIRTGASHVHRWGVDWLNETNTIVLYSSDIGTYAWKKSDSWEKIEITQEISDFGDKIYERLKKSIQ